MAVTYITAEELAALLRAPDKSGTQVVDVRDDDFAGGHIRGCVNITSDKFYEDADLDAVVLRLRGYKRVVFHCHFSQQRGPFSARRYAARLGDDADTQVCVLHGGWRAWRSAFGDDATLTANE